MVKLKKTASELIAELNEDVSYNLKKRKQEEEMQKIKKLLSLDEQIIAHELKSIGLHINSIFDLVNSELSDTKAIPLLIELLQSKRIVQFRTIEGIIRALAVIEAKGLANKTLLELYINSNEEKETYRWAIGNTLNVIITDDDIEDIVKIVSNKENGVSRQMFVLALGKFKIDIVEKTLLSLLEDDQVQLHAIYALGKMKSKKAKPILEDYLKNAKGIVKKEAKKALSKINK